jgi:PD-(D/E)XK nuclease superfamily
MNKAIFRASFSVLNSWSKGYAQDAINNYFKLPKEPNQAMEDGLKHHQSWEKYILANKKLHPQLSTTNKQLKSPLCELKLEMPINDWLEFVGVIDCLDMPILYEFKTGVKPSSEYANSVQADLYFMLCEHHGYEVEKAFYIHFDQYSKETDSAMVWNTKERRQKALEWLTEQSREMYDYLLANGLFEKYEVRPVEEIEQLV